jgi:hypothetical protein
VADEVYNLMVFDAAYLLDECDEIVAGKSVGADVRIGVSALNKIGRLVDSGAKPCCLICKAATFGCDTPPAVVVVIIPMGDTEDQSPGDPAGICSDCCKQVGWDPKAIGIGAADAYAAMRQHPLSGVACHGQA